MEIGRHVYVRIMKGREERRLVKKGKGKRDKKEGGTGQQIQKREGKEEKKIIIGRYEE